MVSYFEFMLFEPTGSDWHPDLSQFRLTPPDSYRDPLSQFRLTPPDSYRDPLSQFRLTPTPLPRERG